MHAVTHLYFCIAVVAVCYKYSVSISIARKHYGHVQDNDVVLLANIDSNF